MKASPESKRLTVTLYIISYMYVYILFNLDRDLQFCMPEMIVLKQQLIHFMHMYMYKLSVCYTRTFNLLILLH